MWTHTDDDATVTDMAKGRISRGTPRRVLGENVRQLREEADLLQDELAAEVRIAGPDWTRATVAAVENDRRNVTVEELVALSTALQAPLSVLLFSGGGHVDLRGLAADVEACRDNVAHDRPVLPSSALEAQRLADTYREHEETEEHAARRLRVSREAIRHAARELWGRPLAAERDLRLHGPEYDAMEPETRRAHRGHVTRGLLRELTQHFTDRGKQ